MDGLAPALRVDRQGIFLLLRRLRVPARGRVLTEVKGKMKIKLLCVMIVLAFAVTAAQAEDKVDGKTVAEKKCKMCHSIDGTGTKKPMKAAGKSAEWVAKWLDGEEKSANGKAHPYKGKLTDDEKKAVIEYVLSISK